MADKEIPRGEVQEREEVVYDVDEIEPHNGEVLLTVDSEGKGSSHLKLAKDGRTILIPQPTDDPDDPLNWSSFKKHAVLLLVAFGSFAGDFGAGAGVPLIFLQGAQWGLPPTEVNRANSLAAVMCGVSGIIWMPLLNSWGRIPVLFWSGVLGFFFTLGAVLAPNFPVHYAMRTLQGVTQSTGQTIGLAFIEDCFFYHEHARKIGIWYAIYICSPFLSPLLANFIIGKTEDWQIIFWCTLAWSGFLLSLILLFGDETYYNRTVPRERQPHRGKGQINRLLRVTGIWQIQHHSGYFATVLSSYIRLVTVFLKPVIALTMLFYAAVFMWMIGLFLSSAVLLATPKVAGGYGLSSISVGCVFFAPIVGVLLGELFGHFFNDFIVKFYARRHGGHFVPEVRLWTTYIGLAVIVPGLVIVGETFQHQLSVAALVFGWGMDVFGVLVTSVATIAFALDCYPSASGEVSALINMARVGAGFAVPYFIEEWTAKQGYATAFGLQAVVVVAAYAIVIFIQLFGARLRAWAGPARHLRLSK
ncbi:hypothetical protein CLAIMM_11112 [Cladophialophora immunda]|nr:hypothetical protein CLAIMM_11112 [Cladophialophora immunda]